MRYFRQFSAHLTKCQACHGLCTVSQLHAGLTKPLATTRNTTHLKCCASTQNDDGILQSVELAFSKTAQKFCACHTNGGSTYHETCWNVFKRPKVTAFVQLRRGTAILNAILPTLTTALADTCKGFANGCKHKSSFWRTRLNPQTPKVKQEPSATHAGQELFSFVRFESLS